MASDHIGWTDPEAMERKVKARRSQQIGEWGQRVAALHLMRIGYKCVEAIHTGTSKVRGERRYTKKVSGDLRAIFGEGRSVLVEVKVREKRVRNSDLKPHQRKALTDHAEAGGMSLVAWVDKGGTCRLFHWGMFPDAGKFKRIEDPAEPLRWGIPS